mgnify:CR=1 FL=1
MPRIPRPLRHPLEQALQRFVLRSKRNTQGELHGLGVHLHRAPPLQARRGAAAMGVRAQPRVADLDPTPRREPCHAVDLQAVDLARMEALMGAKPVFDAVVDPAMEVPEHWVDVGGKRIAKKVVFGRIPTRGKVRRVAGEGQDRKSVV